MSDGRKVQYLIELLPDTKQFEKIREKMKAIDGGELIKFEPSEVKKLKGILQGVVDDVGSRASSIGTKIQEGIAKGINKTQLEKMLDVDTSKLRETMEIVEKLTGLIDDHSKGSSWLKDGKGFLGKLSGSQQDLRNLEQSIGQLELKFEGLDASLTNTIAKFDALATTIRNLQENGKPITVSPINITTDIKGVQQFEKEISDLNTLLTEISDKDIKINTSNVAKDFQKLAREADKLSEKIDDLTYEADAPGLSGDAERAIRMQIAQKKAQLAQMYREMDVMNQHYQRTHSDVTLSLFDDEGIFEDPKDVVKQAKDYIESVIRELSTATKKGATKSDNVLGVEVALPSVDDIKKKLNSVIDQLNKPNSLHKVKLEVDDSVVPVEGRLDKVSEAIEKKLTGEGGILAKTKAWRTEMLKQFKFKSGDFEFQFNNTLIEELQSLFDEYGLKINIDPTYLADQIKTVLEGSSVSLSGGTTSIDKESMTAAVMAGVRAALLGESLPVATETTSAQEKIPDATEQVATEIEQVAKHLDAAEEYVQDVVKKIKAVAKYAVKPADKDTAGTKATRNQFKLWGIDLEKVLGSTDDSQIATMIEQSLLKRGDFNKLFGSTIIDELSSFKGSSSNTIPAFVDSLREMFFMLQEDTETVDEWTRKKHSREVFDYARGRATAADSLRNVRSSIRTDKIPDIEYIDKAIAAMSVIGKNTDSLEALRIAREKLGSNTDEQSVQEFNTVAKDFYKNTTQVFYDIKKQAEDAFKGTVYLQGSRQGVVKKQNVENYKQLARIGDEDVILDIRVTSSLNNVALGTTKSKHKDRISPYEEQRLLDGKRGDYTVSPEYERDILKRELEYGGFKPQGVESAELNIEASIENLKKKIFETAEIIPELQKQITALDEEVETKRREMKDTRAFLETVQNNPNATDAEKLNAKYADVDAHDEFAKALNKKKALREQINSLETSQDRTKNTIQQLELTKQHNELLAKSLELEGSIIKAEKDGAPQKELQERKQELEGIRTQLAEIVSKAADLGGLYQGVASREYSAAERKTYALEQIKLIDNDLITARAQKNVVTARIAKKDKEIAEVDRWGLGAGIGKRALNEEKYKLTSEFMDSDYMKSFSQLFGMKKQLEEAQLAYETSMNHYYDATNKQWDESLSDNERATWAQASAKASEDAYRAEQKLAEIRSQLASNVDSDVIGKLNAARQKADNAVATHMPVEDIQNPERVREFLMNDKAGQHIATQYAKEEKEIWDEYFESLRQKKQTVIQEFKDSIKVEDGVLKGVFKAKDESGKWIDELVEVYVRDALRKRLVDAKEILEEEQTPMQSNIDRLYADRKAAIEYGGVGEKEILSADVIEDQIRREEDLAEKQVKRAESLQKISDLERAGVADSDESIKQEKRKLAETEKQISRLEMLIRNREKLVELRWDESKADSYTDEEKELHFTEQVVSYNQKIENSLARQEELKQKIATASEAEKTQLQYALKQEEDRVAGWRGKVSGFEGQLQNVRTAKSEVAASKTGEVSGGLLGLIKEVVGEANVGNVDLTKVEEILSKILAILSGNGAVGGSARNPDMDAKLARIKELEAKQQLANEQKKTAETVKQVENATKETTVTTNVANSKAHKNVSKTQIYKDIQKSVDTFRISELKADKEPLNAIKLALDELSKINDQNSQEYIEWQRKLGSALAAYGKKNGIENGKGYYDKVYAELEKNGVAVNPKLAITNPNGISNALVEKGLVTIKEKEAKAKQSEAKAEEKITEEKQEQEKIRFTRKEKRELNRLKNETKDYNPDAATGASAKFDGLATENTLRAILEVLNKISTSGVPKRGGKSNGAGTQQNDSGQDDSEMTELERRVGALKGKFKDAISVGYLDENNADLAEFNKQLDAIENSNGTVEQLEEMRKKALALGDVVSKTVAKNKRMYSGTTEINAATRQRSNMEARDILDRENIGLVKEYNELYGDLMKKYDEFKANGTLFDPENQKILQNLAIQTKDLGKELEKSANNSERLRQAIVDSGTINGKKIGHEFKVDDSISVYDQMIARLKELGAEHIKVDKVRKMATGTIRHNNRTVSDLTVEYDKLRGSLARYQKQERESLTGLPAFLNGFQKKFNSIMQYLTMTMSIHQVMAQLRRGVQYIREIDLALTELKKVTDETEETYDKFLQTAAKTGERLGTTISAVTEATATFAKLGYTMEQATEMAEAAIVYKNVGDNIASTGDAADSIISTMKGFKLEATEAMAIVDRFNEVKFLPPYTVMYMTKMAISEKF